MAHAVSEQDAPNAAEVRERAIKLLGRREHAPAELALKLGQRGYPQSLVAQVLAQLIEENLLSSTRYAESLVRVRIEKGAGPVRIRNELSGHAIDTEIIENALVAADVDWAALATQVRHKRFGAGMPEDFPAKARQMRFLQQRGFTSAQIQHAFDA